jgi:16S rRNA (guanine1207-N2)-methyltransferase
MLRVTIKGYDLELKTHPKLFSPLGLDAGTAAMLSLVEFGEGQRVLDLGCGYGVVGIVAAKIVGEENVVLVDQDPLAVRLARENSIMNGVSRIKIHQSDGFTGFSDTGFDLILSNPPYHSDFSVPKAFIEKGFNRLLLGGKMYMVTKRQTWYKNKLVAIFGGVQISCVDGYYVFMSEKRSTQYAQNRIRGGK